MIFSGYYKEEFLKLSIQLVDLKSRVDILIDESFEIKKLDKEKEIGQVLKTKEYIYFQINIMRIYFIKIISKVLNLELMMREC